MKPLLDFTKRNLEVLCASNVKEHVHPWANVSAASEVLPTV